MSDKRNTEAEEYNTLKSLGFEFHNPQDGYSYQPDSGGIASGALGKQEYGIEVDLALGERSYESNGIEKDGVLEDSTQPIPGESEFSQINRLPQEKYQNPLISEDDHILFELIQGCLDGNPNIEELDILVEVENGAVTLTGEVTNEETRILINEVIVDLPGVESLSNNLCIS